ncbi:MAG TPA: hypothetical protein VN643_19060 [Pyrinomonadaceae bacterium]|nr:hypothetical protein [Pyrinomonadaceae bacterium]
MKDHTEHLLDALFEEYKQLSTSFDKHVGVSYSIPPVVLTIVTGFFFFSASSSLIGFGVAVGAVFLFIWQGLIHSMVNHLGVHLVELEIRINRIIEPDSKERIESPLSFYGRFVARSANVVPGFRHYYALLEVFVIVILVPASMRSWWTMMEWGFATYLRVVFVAIPPALIIIIRLIMRYVDRAAIARINALGDSLA